MSVQCGIIGLPNAGKSTLFNVLTKANVPADHFPFCTIEPNTGVVSVPDHRLNQLAKWVQPQQTIPAYVQFVDIAGLVKGASHGEGLGNQFLSHIRAVDATIHVVRCFDHAHVSHVAARIDPIDDMETIETELCLADLQLVEKMLEKLNKKARTGDAAAKKQCHILQKAQADLSKGLPPGRSEQYTPSEKDLLQTCCNLITTTPNNI